MSHPLYDHPTWIAAVNPEDMYHHRDAMQCDAPYEVPGQGTWVCTLVKAHASPDHLAYDSQGNLCAAWPT